ncbi:MAG: hypothetical protein KGS61_20795 [Verrucomicrobia bacterium]|nr:hypothetical protein [Verrucomicrobiota bacterium]
MRTKNLPMSRMVGRRPPAAPLAELTLVRLDSAALPRAEGPQRRSSGTRSSCILIVLLVAVAFRGASWLRADEDEKQPARAAQSRVSHGADGQTLVTLTAEEQRLIGLHTAVLAATNHPAEIKAYGRVLDPAALIQFVGEQDSARAALTASRQEYERQKHLLAQGPNTSVKALETARAAMQRDQIALVTVRTRLLSEWGPVLADRPDLAAFVGLLARREVVLARLDLPTGQGLAASPQGARLIVPGAASPLPAEVIGRAPMTDAAVQGAGFLLTATNRPPELAPGLVLIGYLSLPGTTLHGALVPESAVVRSAGRTWVYLQSGPTTFARQEVSLDWPMAGGWLVTRGVKAGGRAVVQGAQDLLSEERKSEIKPAD